MLKSGKPALGATAWILTDVWLPPDTFSLHVRFHACEPPNPFKRPACWSHLVVVTGASHGVGKPVAVRNSSCFVGSGRSASASAASS
jgi:hypothetical protein